MIHIQTEVPDEEYERLRQVAEQQGLSIREALREATELRLETQEAIDPSLVSTSGRGGHGSPPSEFYSVRSRGV